MTFATNYLGKTLRRRSFFFEQLNHLNDCTDRLWIRPLPVDEASNGKNGGDGEDYGD